MNAAIISQMEETNLSPVTIKYTKVCLNSFTKFCNLKGFKPFYSENLIKKFLDYTYELYLKEDIKYGTLQNRRKAIFFLEQYNETGKYKPKHAFFNSKYTLHTQYFINFLKDECLYYKQTNRLSEGSNEQNYYVTKKFCFYLENLGFKNFKKLTVNVVINFINSVKETNKGSMKSIIHNVKRILEYLDEKNIIQINADLSILKPQFTPSKEIVTFSKDEITKILDAIDRNTDIGKRDYAIILLGITTGLRACDVVSLTLNNINWEKEYIKVVQIKTGKEIKVPMLSNISNALATYILKARPKSDSATLFLTYRNPIKQMIPYSLNNILRKYYTKVNIVREKKETFNSLRRSFCTWLAQELTPVDLIAECAGHSNVHTAERYISVSPIMTQCCLDFSGINPFPKGGEDV